MDTTVRVTVQLDPERIKAFLEERLNALAWQALAELAELKEEGEEKLVRVEVKIKLGKKPTRGLLKQPVAGLNLSVRGRKAMERLGIETLGELIKRTAQDLLDGPGAFGTTSLNEVRWKLREKGLKLRGD